MKTTDAQTCFTCYHGEVEGRGRSECKCLWPATNGGIPDIIHGPSDGVCNAYQVHPQHAEFEDELTDTIALAIDSM
jgi:hypothetical protein